MNKIMTEDELQYIEHCNKVLTNHLEVVETVTSTVKMVVSEFLPALSDYVQTIQVVQDAFGTATSNIIKSTREMKVITSGSNELQNYISAVIKLDSVLNDKIIEEIIRLVKDNAK